MAAQRQDALSRLRDHGNCRRAALRWPRPAAVSDGALVVGTDVLPGGYRTNGQCQLGICGWSPLVSVSTDDVIGGGAVSGPTPIEIQPSDKAVVLIGSCRWSKIG
jgi:hypothetical protein